MTKILAFAAAAWRFYVQAVREPAHWGDSQW